VQEDDIPFTALEIRFRGGSSLDPIGKEGAVNLMTALLEEGAADMDAQAFAAARDSLAASFRFSSDIDTVAVSAQFLTENRDQAVDLLHKAILSPRFDADAIERVRAQFWRACARTKRILPPSPLISLMRRPSPATPMPMMAAARWKPSRL
jgi:zinc protease